MSTNNDTAAILAALDAAGLEVQELEWEEMRYAVTISKCRKYEVYYRKQKWFAKSKDNIKIICESVDCSEAIAAANAHNRELVAGMLRVKEAK